MNKEITRLHAQLADLQEIAQASADATRRACMAEAQLAEVQMKLRVMKDVCEVCWTSSPTPVELEADCYLTHPHEGVHARCEYCWLHKQWAEAQREVERLTVAQQFSQSEHQHGIDVCAYCAAGDIARARLMELEAERDALRALVRAAQVAIDRGAKIDPDYSATDAIARLKKALAHPAIVALGKEKNP